jgi:hypothetical protein
MSTPDRRRAQRIALQQAVSLVIGNGGHEVPAITESLSSAGVLLYADRFIREGALIGLVLVLPAIQAETEGQRVWCLGKIVRIERELKEGKFGLAIGFQRYELLHQA